MILVRVLSKHDYAQYSLILYTAAFLGAWVDLGMERSVARFTPEIEASAARDGRKRFLVSPFGIKLAGLAPLLLAFIAAPEFFIRVLALGAEGEILLWGIAAL